MAFNRGRPVKARMVTTKSGRRVLFVLRTTDLLAPSYSHADATSQVAWPWVRPTALWAACAS